MIWIPHNLYHDLIENRIELKIENTSSQTED